MENRPAKESQNEREGALPAVSVPGAREKIWAYDKDSGFWRLVDERGEIVQFKLTAGRHAAFEGFLLPEHEEDYAHQLQNILQDATHLLLVIQKGSNNQKWSNMFLQVIQTSENPAPSLQLLSCWYFQNDGELETLISRLQYLRDLRDLHLIGARYLSHVNLGRVMELGQLQTLETLDLRGNKLDDDDCKVYASALQSGRVEGLSQIDFSGNEISDSGAEALARAFQSGHVKSLRVLKLGGNRIGDDGMVALGSAFESGGVEGLSQIDFASNSISDSGAAALARAFQSGRVKNLQEVNLSRNRIGDDGMVALGNAFESGGVEGLSHIDFSSNQICCSSAAALARAFQSGRVKSLQELNLDSNKIGDEGMVALGSAFASDHMQKLEQVHLNYNRVGAKGMVHLATVLETSNLPNLHSLDLFGNEAGVTGIKGMAKALESGNLSSLRKLHLSQWNSNDRSNDQEFERSFEPLIQALSNNTSLIVEVKTESVPVNRRLRRQRELNAYHVQLLSAAGDRKVPAKFGKVYLCGNPLVGKTTLRRSLDRSKLRSLFTRETGKHEEPRTRGIDVCQITSKGGHGEKKTLSLAVWDVAGQYDYHMVHNAFLRDLASSKANATIFVVICSSLTKVSMAEKELENWFRFIASSISPISPTLRDVFVVINRIHGDSAIMEEGISNEWKCLLAAQAKKFENYLKIKEDPFIIDVRKWRHVEHFKKSLIKQSEKILKNVEVPEICDFILNYLSDWVATREQFPVLSWSEVQSELRKRGASWPQEILHIAFKYLNEVGALIFIEKVFHEEHLVVANPTWLCKEILGNMFLPEGMGVPTNQLFRDKVDPITGSILISDFKLYFRWSENVKAPNSIEKHQLLSILLWLGVCFLGHENNIIIPALICADAERRKRVQGLWNQSDLSKDRKGQWVMGFLVEHVLSHTALAPMALWHRFQVKLARISKFNGNTGDESFVAGQYYVTFKVEYMVVLVQVNANETDQPSFESIEVLVKPLWTAKRDDVDINTRKQRQVDIAGDIANLLVDLWDEVCPGVGFMQRVIWPWPISSQRPKLVHEKNYAVAKLKVKLEEQDCWGQAIQENVGEDDIVTWDQLLSTSDKKRMKDYVSTQHIPKEKVGDTFALSGSFSHLLLENILEVKELVLEGNEGIQKTFQMLKDFDQTFFEDQQSTCPKVMYMGEKNSSLCKQIKDLMALPITSIHLHFLCEAFYDEKGHGLHVVMDQEGIDVSDLKQWARKLAPWIKYSILILVTLAKIGSNFVIPGLGLAIPSFVDWQQALSLSDGIAAVTGYTEKQLDELIISNIKGKEKSSLFSHPGDFSNPRQLYGHSKTIMTDILGKLKAPQYMQKLRLLKVRLCNSDGSLIGVRWICYDCLDKYRNAGHNVFEL